MNNKVNNDKIKNNEQAAGSSNNKKLDFIINNEH